MKPLAPIHAAVLLVAIVLAGCNQPSPGLPASPEHAAAPVSDATPVISAPAQPGTAGLPGDHAATKHYKISITLPKLPADAKPLAAALRATADEAKREFMQALPDPQQLPEFADRQFEMLLDFKLVATTPVFTSVRETGMQDTGGAHPLPVDGAFVFDRKVGKLITLDDLFADPAAARKALAHFAHDVLLKQLLAHAPKPGEGSPAAIREWKTNTVQMLDDGTQPTTVNYSVFVVRAGTAPTAASPGLTLIFPPYQVAAYVYGTQTVEVPANAFAKYLKPEYRDAFAP